MRVTRTAADRAIPALLPFAANVRAARARRGLTQEGLAYESGLTAGEVSRVERAIREPRVLTVVRLANALGIPPGELLADLGEHG